MANTVQASDPVDSLITGETAYEFDQRKLTF